MGVPEAQAEAQAELMAQALVFNMDAVVTKDYLEQCLDARFASQDAHIDKKFAVIDVQFSEMKGNFRLIYWMQAVTIAVIVIPSLQGLLTRFALGG